MTSYTEVTGRRADFRVRYEWIETQPQRPYQHMRCDFSYVGDDVHRDGLYMIWPEFENDDGDILPEETEIPHRGFASMWIVAPAMRQVHRTKAQVGAKC